MTSEPQSRSSRDLIGHVYATASLGLPLIGSQLAQTVLNMTNGLVTARLGPDELAACVLGWHFFFVVWMFGAGFGFAVMPLVSSAIGGSDRLAGSRFVRMGLWVTTIYALLMMPLFWNAERIFLIFGQSARIAELSGEYLSTLHWSLIPQLVIIVLRSFLGARERPGIVFVALAVAVALNVGLSVILVFGAFSIPPLGVAGAGLSTFLATACVALFLALYVARHPAFREQKVFARLLSPDTGAMARVFLLGWPIGTAVVAEVGFFAASSFMMGWFGSAPLAAHGIALQLSTLVFTIPLGLSAAATVRVGNAYGRGDRSGASRAAWTAILLATVFTGTGALMFLTIPRALAGIYLDLNAQETVPVVPFAVSFLAVAALFQVVDGIQSLASGSLRGLHDTRVPMLIALVSYWVIGVPGGYWLAFGMGLGGIGIWWGLALGLTSAAALMTARLSWQILQMARS